jgi:N-methylhydantoinase B/oxoprolinase/acetone carboxylase alpha subunit
MPNQLIAGSADPIWMSVWRGRWQETNKPATFTMFQVGGTGARATKDGLNTTGFPRGVAGVPAEVVEPVFPIIQHQREFRTNSGEWGNSAAGLGKPLAIAIAVWETGAFLLWLTAPISPRKVWRKGNPARWVNSKWMMKSLDEASAMV